MQRTTWRIVFKYLNRYLMVPAFRLGLGRLVSNPFTGYVMVLKTRGKKSGKVRYAPINYAIINGNIYCIAGWGRGTHWFANLKAHPRVELLLPGRAISGIAEEVADPNEARRAIVRVARNAGLPLAVDGLNPITATDGEILDANGWMPVVRIRATGTGSGPDDPGGWAWTLPAGCALLWLFSRKRS